MLFPPFVDLAVACLGVGLPCASGGRGAHQDQGVFPGASWNDAHENRKVFAILGFDEMENLPM